MNQDELIYQILRAVRDNPGITDVSLIVKVMLYHRALDFYEKEYRAAVIMALNTRKIFRIGYQIEGSKLQHVYFPMETIISFESLHGVKA